MNFFSICARRFFIFSLFACCRAAPNRLKKVFFHQGILADKLVFYCTQQPTIVSCKDNKNGHCKFSCELMGMNGYEPSCQDRIEYINKLQKTKIKKSKKNLPYSLSIIVGEKKSAKVSVEINYDPEYIEIDQREFESISNSPAVVFTIVRKKAVEKSDRKKERWFSLEEIQKKRKIRIVIDAGHGGADAGACGKGGVAEKDVTLKVGRLLAKELEERGYQVRQTRTADVYVPLDERTAIANLIANADLFVSLHGNASFNPRAHGVETYFLSPLKNPHSPFELFAASFTRGAQKLAHEVQSSIVSSLKEVKFGINDRGVKNAVSQVLLGVEAPAVLVEMGFISNEDEAKQLNNARYQKLMANGIAEGIIAYIDKA